MPNREATEAQQTLNWAKGKFELNVHISGVCKWKNNGLSDLADLSIDISTYPNRLDAYFFSST